MTTTPVMISVPHATNLNSALRSTAVNPNLERVLAAGSGLPIAEDHVFISFVISPPLAHLPGHFIQSPYSNRNASIVTASLGSWKRFVTDNLNEYVPQDYRDSARTIYEYINTLPLTLPFKGWSKVQITATEYMLVRS